MIGWVTWKKKKRERGGTHLVACSLSGNLGSIVRDGSGRGVGHDEENGETRGMDSSD
jgi:hypothetical protein